MKVKYEIIEEDLIDYNMFYASVSPTVKRTLLIQQYLVPFVYLSIPFLLYFLNGDPLIFFLPPFAILALLWFLFYPKYFKWTVRKRVSKMINEGDNKGTVGAHELTFTPDEIIEVGEFGEGRVKWDIVQKVFTTDKHIFIFIGAMKAYIIPKRSFVDENNYRDFLRSLEDFTKIRTKDYSNRR